LGRQSQARPVHRGLPDGAAGLAAAGQGAGTSRTIEWNDLRNYLRQMVDGKTAVEGEGVEIATVGVYELPKLVSAVIAASARVACDDTAKQVVLPSTGMGPIGIATVAARNGLATVRARLDGVATQAA
jgi:predicted RecA/RadA family phage recombinase